MHSSRLTSCLSGCITSLLRTSVGQRAYAGTVSPTGTFLLISYCPHAAAVCHPQTPNHCTALSDDPQRFASAVRMQHQELRERCYSTVVALASSQKRRQQTPGDRRLQEQAILRPREPRKRMKLFPDLQDYDLAVADTAKEHDTAAAAAANPTAEAATSITARAATAAARELYHGSLELRQQQDLQQEEQQQQLHQQRQQHRSPSLAASADRQQVYVFWDLDNKNPSEWLGMPIVINNLKTALSKFGTVASISAYSNTNTLTWVVPGEMGGGADDNFGRPNEPWGMLALEEEIGDFGDDALRCPLCGRKCKSIEDRNKHFRQLHEREHKKKMGSGKHKITAKYLATDKAARYRTAMQVMALPRTEGNSSGKKGQLVKLLLQQHGVNLKDVPNGPQAADVMMTSHIRYLASTLRSQEQQRQRQQQEELELNTEQQQETHQQQQAVKQPKSKHKSKQQQPHSVSPAARMSDAVLVVVSDDRGFRELAKNWLIDGAGVVLVAARDIESWDTPRWQMSSDGRIEFLDWYDLL